MPKPKLCLGAVDLVARLLHTKSHLTYCLKLQPSLSQIMCSSLSLVTASDKSRAEEPGRLNDGLHVLLKIPLRNGYNITIYFRRMATGKACRIS